MRHFLALALLLVISCPTFAVDARPNILWITIEDWGPELSCYGTKGIRTPHVDKLASEGIRYQWAFTTSPVCSTSRSAMMTGFHQNFIGANQHRENNKQPLPHGIRPIPHLMQEAGYPREHSPHGSARRKRNAVHQCSLCGSGLQPVAG